MTTKELYEQMLARFAVHAGRTLDPGCDLAVRLYTAAAQLETLYQYADWSRRQAFVQTADGQYLDYHGQMRGLTRHPASRARGTVQVRLSDAQPVDLDFPAGMRLLAAGDVELTLDDDYTLPHGVMRFYANVTAVEPGPQGNLPAQSLLMFSGGPTCVQSVTVVDALTGGMDTESDEAFRARILESLQPGSNGANMAYYRSVALAVDGIVACQVLPCLRGPLTVDIVAADENGLPSSGQLSEISLMLQQRRELGIDLSIRAPTRVLLDVDVQLRCKQGVSFSEAQTAAEAAIRGCFTGKLLGTPVYESALSHLVFNTGLVEDCVVDMDGRGSTVAPDELPMLEQLTIREVH